MIYCSQCVHWTRSSGLDEESSYYCDHPQAFEITNDSGVKTSNGSAIWTSDMETVVFTGPMFGCPLGHNDGTPDLV